MRIELDCDDTLAFAGRARGITRKVSSYMQYFLGTPFKIFLLKPLKLTYWHFW
jgi:hypothetical protein